MQEALFIPLTSKTEKGEALIKTIKLIYHTNIERVGTLIAGAFPAEEVEELQARALEIRAQYGNNESAWIYFIMELSNAQINHLASVILG